MTDPRAKWDARYASTDWLHRPKALLAEVDWPAGGRALDLACGEGHTLRWLADRGFDVTGVDISPVGLAKARAQVPDATLIEADLTTWPLGTDWDVVCCLHYFDRDLLPRIRAAVRPGGLAVVEVLTSGINPAWCADPGELAAAFTGWQHVVVRETERSSQLVARRP